VLNFSGIASLELGRWDYSPTNSLVIYYMGFSNRVSSSQTTTAPVSIVVVMILVMEFEEREGVSLVGQTSPGCKELSVLFFIHM
jgi:hypothetical protein